MLIQFLVRILAYPLKIVKQPRVIAEVLAGIKQSLSSLIGTDLKAQIISILTLLYSGH